MTKTIEQWLKEGLTPEQFENAQKCKRHTEWNMKINLLSKAIVIGFDWGYMPEGWDYWNSFCERISMQGL